MIHIDLQHRLPTEAIPGSHWTPWTADRWQAWLDKSADLVSQLAELEQQNNRTERNALIDANSAHWGSLKEWLKALSGGKCWFTGVRELCSHYDVEHFRPKKEAKDDIAQEARDGYWWLAFDFMNYRLCGTVPNRAKGGWFPLRTGSMCASYDNPCHDSEIAYFLDPIDEGDVALIAYDEEGKVIPVPGCSEWDRERVTVTAKRFKLNEYAALTDERRKIWKKVDDLINDFLNAQDLCKAGPNPAAKQKMLCIRQQLKELTSKDAELYAVARWCLYARNIPLLMQLAA